MANPTGTAYLAANLNYIWSDGDVYQIPQTDTVEAAGSGASFNGLGVANQPHQQLLNKFQQLHNKQLTDEASLTALLALLTTITSDIDQSLPGMVAGSTGWLKVGSNDISLGGIQIIWQWGQINLLPFGQSAPGSFPATLAFDFPISFPNACFMIQPRWLIAGSGTQSVVTGAVGLVAIAPLQKQANAFGYFKQTFGGEVNPTNGYTGISWAALGY